MCALEVAEAPFQPPADALWEKVAAAFGDHVRGAAGNATGKPGQHHLYAEFLGTPHEGATEVRFVVVDAAGEPAIVDRQTPADRDFKRTAGRDPDPLGCASLVGERLFTLADWKKAPTAVPDGKFAKMWREMSGMPDPKEQKAIDERRAALGKSVASARFVLMPTIVDGKHDNASAARLAGLLAAEFGCHAEAKLDGARIEVKPDSNEQKRLWDLAWGLRDAVKKQPVEADATSQHTLVVDIAMGPGGTPGFVHVVICNAAGEHVVVDMQNDQHEMLRRAAPKTLEEAEQFAVKRLAKLLQ
jgi:hypothetical protein